MKQVHVQEARKSSSTDDKMFKKLRQNLNSGEDARNIHGKVSSV